MRVSVLIGLGSNLDDPAARVRAGLAALADIEASVVSGQSALYGSAPMGPPDQPDYVNAAARLDTELDAHALLDALQRIERAAGRRRDGGRWGPRVLDLDLLLYGDHEIVDDRLHVPHPGIMERAFVLVPLAEIDPRRSIPGRGTTVGAACAALPADAVWRLEDDPA